MITVALKKLEKIINLSKIGTVINGGTQSIILEPFICGTEIENPVLVITFEKEKFIFLQELFKGSAAKVEKTFLFGNFQNIDIFYMSRMEPLPVHSSVATALEDIFQHEWEAGEDLDIQHVVETIFIESVTFNHGEMLCPADLKIISAIKEALKAFKNCGFKAKYYIDLHGEQFCQFGKSIFCVDPILFNTNYRN